MGLVHLILTLALHGKSGFFFSNNIIALSINERFGRCGCKAAWWLRNRFWKRLHWFLRKTLGPCHTSGLAAWPLRLRRLSSLETAAAKPLGYVRRAFLGGAAAAVGSASWTRSNGKSWTELARPLLPCQTSDLAATKLQRFISGQTARVTWQKRPGRQRLKNARLTGP